MKKIIFLLLFSQKIFAQSDTTKVDTTIRYNLQLTETQYRGLMNVMSEAAKYEAEQQQQKTIEAMNTFLKSNLKTIPNKEQPK